MGRRLVEVRGGVVRGRRAWGTLRASLAPFLTIELPRCVVWVGGPGGTVRGRCDRQGYLDVPVDVGGLAPGWHELSVTAAWRGAEAAVPVPVYVVDPGSRVAVISDLDDTVIETGITRGLEMLRLTLLTSVSDRTPLTGAAELYRALTAARGGPARPVFYLSTSPWNLYELLTRFLVLRGFPAGPLLLTDWGPSRTNLFRLSPEQHKLTMIRALLEQHPGLGVVLIGDTGEQDPEIYATVAQESPDRVRAVYVRRTAGMPAARAIEVSGLIRRVAAAGVPMLMVEDSVQIAEHAAGLGLLDPADVQAVRRATQL
ncbi:MAG TPA: phosphatase domain-containing protein [Mycobacteriales bacterium]|nr:phosphatase domain-containing protein [Mycobacteriales bacterium]